MKKLLVLLGIITLPIIALAQAAPAVVAPYVPPQWAQDIVTWLMQLPKIGPIVGMVLLTLGVVASLMTVVAAALDGFIKATSGMAKLAGADAFAQKILNGYSKIEPYVKYLSMYNVQKKDDAPKPQ